MPKVPKWLGDTMETVFSSQYIPVTVTQKEDIVPGLRKIRFEGDLSKKQFTPGMVIEFRVSENEYRHYTPSFFDAEKGICDVIFYLHDKGPGSKWAESLKKGDETKLIGPGGKIRYQKEFSHQVVFGDETSLSQFVCLNEAFIQDGKQSLFIYESPEKNSHWAKSAGIGQAIALSMSMDAPAAASVTYIQNLSDSEWNLWKTGAFYLTGRAKSIQAVRKALTERGVNMKQIKTEPYWSEGKPGL